MHKKKIYHRLTGVACFLIGVLATIFSLFLMPIGGSRAQTLTTATFLLGKTVNLTLKSLATGATVTNINDVDTLIQQIVRTGTIPAGVTTGLLSTNDSETPIIAWFDDGILYYYSEADILYLNQNSSFMFNKIQSGTYIDTSGWDTSNVTNMGQIFYGCSSLTELDVSKWDTSSVTDMQLMFIGCSSLTELNLSGWDTSSVTNMQNMFSYCSSLTELDVSNWDTSSVTNMSSVFEACTSLTGLDVSSWNTSNVTNMQNMFAYSPNLTRLDVSNWDTSKVTNMAGLFEACRSLTGLDISNWNTSSVTNMSYMFDQCTNLTELDVSNFVTSGVTNMQSMFSQCTNLTELDVNGWDTRSVTNMNYMFGGCRSLTGLDVSNWDTRNVINMSTMFQGCINLTELDVSHWDTRSVINMQSMFSNCSKLNTIYASTGFITSGVTNSTYMFLNTPRLIGGHGTKSPSLGESKSGAVLDSESALGYLTYDIAVSYRTRSGVELARQVINVGDTTVVPIIHRTGYAVSGWYLDTGYITLFDFSQPLRSYTELYVEWKCNSGYAYSNTTSLCEIDSNDDGVADMDETYLVTFYSNGGTPVPSQYILSGEQITMVTPTRTGSIFEGWYYDEDNYYVIDYDDSNYPQGCNTSGLDSPDRYCLLKVYSSNEFYSGSNGFVYVAPYTTESVQDGYSAPGYCAGLNTAGLSWEIPGSHNAMWTTLSNQRSKIYQFIASGSAKASHYRLGSISYNVLQSSTNQNCKLGAGCGNQDSQTRLSVRCISKDVDKPLGYELLGQQYSGEGIIKDTTFVAAWSCMTGYILDGNSCKLFSVFEKNGANNIGATIITGDTIIFPDIIRSGWTVLGWSTDSGATVAQYAVGEEIQVTGSNTFYAITVRDITATFEVNGADSIGVDSLYCTRYNTQGTICTGIAPSITRSGGAVIGWSTNSGATIAQYHIGDTMTWDGDTTFYAITKKTYTATFEVNGADSIGSSILSCTGYNKLGCTVTAPSIIRSGWTILGWSKDSGSSVASHEIGDTIKLYDDVMYYAITKKSSTILFNANGATSIGATGLTCLQYNTDTGCRDYKYFVQGDTVDGVGVLSVCNPDDSNECLTMMDRNLGASSTGDFGYYFKYGATQGGNINWNNRVTFSGSTWGGNRDNIDNGYGYPINHLSERQGPCPDGYHVPSKGEWGKLLEWRIYGSKGEGNILTYNYYEGIPSLYADDDDSNYYYSKVLDALNGFRKDFYIPLAGKIYIYDNGHGSQTDSNRLYLATSSRGYLMGGGKVNAEVVYLRLGSRTNTIGAIPIRCFKDTGLVNNDVSYTDISLPTITRDGWEILGRSTDPNANTGEYAVGDELLFTGDMVLYAITRGGQVSATFKPNGNLLDSGTSDVVRSCTLYNANNTCEVITPTISNTVTPTVVGYSLSSVGTTDVDIGFNTVADIAGGEVYYAQTARYAEYTATFLGDGTSNDEVCNSAVFNGDTTPTSCTVVAPYPHQTNSGVFYSTVGGINLITICDNTSTGANQSGGRETCITMMDRNIGATTNNINSTGLYGNYYQWGNNYGFSSNTGDIVTGNQQVNCTPYGVNNQYSSEVFILGGYNSWCLDVNTGMWGGGEDNDSNGYGYPMTNALERQGPCPEGYHVPSAGEWMKLFQIYDEYYSNNDNGGGGDFAIQFVNDFKMPSAGGLLTKESDILGLYPSFVGGISSYWSSTYGGYFKANEDVVNIDIDNDYGAGLPVRCFKNVPETREINDDKIFIGWTSVSESNVVEYDPGDEIVLTGDSMYYAVMGQVVNMTYDANGGIFPAQPGFVTHYEGDIIYTGTNGEIFTGIGTITITTGDRTITMLDRNLGARVAGTGCIYPTETVTTKASSSDYTCMGDNDVYGYHFQWGNNHGFIPCTGEQGCTDFPGGETISNDVVDISDYSREYPYSSGSFVIRNSDWFMGEYVNLWGGRGDGSNDAIGTNNTHRQGPCPEGFHVPSAAEWHEVDDLRCNGEGIINKCEYKYTQQYVQLNKNISLAGTSNNPIGGVVHDFENDFLIPYAGYRDYNNGDVGYVGKDAYFWTSSSPNCAVGGKASICTNFYSYHLGYQDKKYDPRNNVDRNLSEVYDTAKGYSVRCFSDEYAVYDTGARIIGIDYTQVEVRYIYNDNEDEYMALDTYREPVRSGYIFDGWCADTGCNIPFENSGIENGIIVYAKWICPVGYMDNGDECVPSDDTPYQVKHYVKDVGLMTYSLYDTQDFSGTTNDLLLLSGYARDDIPCAEYMSGSLTGDTTGPGHTVQSTTILPDGSTTLYLYYKRRVYTVDLSKDMFTSLVEGAGTYECGQEVQIRAYPIDGYHFDMWEGNVD